MRKPLSSFSLMPSRAVVIDEGRIVAVTDAGLPWPEGAEIIDGRGCWVVPGLVDPHVHLTTAGTTMDRTIPRHRFPRA